MCQVSSLFILPLHSILFQQAARLLHVIAYMLERRCGNYSDRKVPVENSGTAYIRGDFAEKKNQVQPACNIPHVYEKQAAGQLYDIF